jgi:hypothetical protein
LVHSAEKKRTAGRDIIRRGGGGGRRKKMITSRGTSTKFN